MASSSSMIEPDEDWLRLVEETATKLIAQARCCLAEAPNEAQSPLWELQLEMMLIFEKYLDQLEQ